MLTLLAWTEHCSIELDKASWNATVIHGDVAEEVRRIKDLPGRDIVKYGTGSLDKVLFAEGLVDLLCIIVYPFVLGHGTHMLEELKPVMHLRLSHLIRWKSGAAVIEYTPPTK